MPYCGKTFGHGEQWKANSAALSPSRCQGGEAPRWNKLTAQQLEYDLTRFITICATNP